MVKVKLSHGLKKEGLLYICCMIPSWTLCYSGPIKSILSYNRPNQCSFDMYPLECIDSEKKRSVCPWKCPWVKTLPSTGKILERH